MISEKQKPVDSGFGAKSEPSEVLEGIDLNGKVAMVTGGYSGIGLETARGLKDAGARVIVPARRTDVAKSELSGIVDDGDILGKIVYPIYPDVEEVIDVYSKALEYGFVLFKDVMSKIDYCLTNATPQDTIGETPTYYSNKENTLLGERGDFKR